MDFLFAANDMNSGAQTALGESVKADSFPDHPGERPSKAAHIKWVKKWRASLSTQGYAAPLRGDTPYEIKKLQDRSRIPDPDGKNASIAAENARIDHQNLQNEIERSARLDEIKNRLASKLATSMENTAPLRLAALQKKFQSQDEHGELIDKSYDGVSMFLEEEVAAHDGEVSEYDAKRYGVAYEKLRDHPCKANITPQAYSTRINLFTTYVNPFLGEFELKGKTLSKYFISQLPSELGTDARSLRRDLDSNGDINSPSVVSAACLKIVEEAFDGTKTSPVDVGVQLVAEAFNVMAVPVAVASHGGKAANMADSTTAAIQAEVARLLGVAAHSKSSGAAKKKAAKAAAAALAATAAASKAKGKGKGGFKLPAGTRCSKGTCDFNHDEHYPGEPCYRDPNWAGGPGHCRRTSGPTRPRVLAS